MNPPQRRFTKIEESLFFGIGLVAVAEIVTHFTHWERRLCYALAMFFTALVASTVHSGSVKAKILRGVMITAVVLFIYFVWR